MKVTGLGHSSFLLEMQGGDGKEVRILGDPWLTDLVIGDLMGRVPRIDLDHGQLPSLDGIYLSHSHTDHLDPYSLIPLWERLDPKPALLVPRSIAYLVPVLGEYLAGASFIILDENEARTLGGVTVRGLFNLEENGTNEDDVMMLLVESERELFLAEADAVLPYGSPEARGAIASLIDDSIESAVFLPIKNELDALMASVHAADRDDRRALVGEALAKVDAEIEETYAPVFEGQDVLWGDPRIVRLIGGQGICFPQTIDPEWNRVLFPIPLEERARREREVATREGHALHVAPLIPGQTLTIEPGSVGTSAAPFLELRDEPAAFVYDDSVERFEDFPQAPLTDRIVGPEELEPKLLPVLNQRFLPWVLGRRKPPVEHLLSAYGGCYRIRVLYPTGGALEERDYEITFERLRFERVEADDDAQEVYWAADLDDYLEGRCDDFSTFCRRSPGGDARHLWDCLGMPYVNNDLIEKKMRFHFERARQGETVESFVLPFWKW